MLKVSKMFWVESILEAANECETLVKEGKMNQQYWNKTVKHLPFYCSKELTIRCFMRKTKEQLNCIYNDLKTLKYKFE